MLDSVKKYENEYVEFIREIVRIPSVVYSEGDLAKFFLEKVKGIGVKEAFIDEAGNVVGVIRGSGKGPNIMLNGHLDTVPTGGRAEEHWKPYGPFEGAVDNGNIIGLGVCDLKAGLAAQFYALKVIQEAVSQNKITLPGDLIFSCVVHEESVGMLGMKALIEETFPKHNLKCDIVYLCEPTSNDLYLGHRGKIELVVKTYGKTAHSSQPALGINALEKMVPILEIIFNKLSTTLKLKKDPVLGERSITITNLLVKPGTMSIVPDECEISVDRRYIPGETDEEILDGFNKIFKELEATDKDFKASVEPRYLNETTYTGYKKTLKKYHPPWRVERDHPLVDKTFKALQSVGQDPKPYYWAGGTDGSMTCALHSIPTLGYSGAELQWAHKPNEQVTIKDMVKTFEGYIAIVSTLMGIDINTFN
jgi:putative selenium metabolism hydrolase